MIKNCLLFLVVSTLLMACHTSNKEIRSAVENSDSVAVNYFNEAVTDSVVAVKIIRDKHTMDQLTDLISADTTAFAPHSGVDGSIHFFKQDAVVEDVFFTLHNDSSMFFFFKQDGRIVATTLSPSAKQLLQSLEK
jgi:hypothetical protein